MIVGIKNFEMPKDCKSCKYKSECFYDSMIDSDYLAYKGKKKNNCPLIEAIPKDNVYKAIQELMKYEHEGFINISLARLDEILKNCGVSEDGNNN